MRKLQRAPSPPLRPPPTLAHSHLADSGSQTVGQDLISGVKQMADKGNVSSPLEAERSGMCMFTCG